MVMANSSKKKVRVAAPLRVRRAIRTLNATPLLRPVVRTDCLPVLLEKRSRRDDRVRRDR